MRKIAALHESFNPRPPPVRGRPRQPKCYVSKRQFQSAPPREGATQAGWRQVKPDSVSIRAPPVRGRLKS